jgi:hypothetical protein
MSDFFAAAAAEGGGGSLFEPDPRPKCHWASRGFVKSIPNCIGKNINNLA